MDKTHIQQTKETLAGQRLLAECERYNPGVGFICKAKDIGLNSFLQCLEKDPCRCPFSVRYSRSYFCRSSARIYIAKELKYKILTARSGQ